MVDSLRQNTQTQSKGKSKHSHLLFQIVNKRFLCSQCANLEPATPNESAIEQDVQHPEQVGHGFQLAWTYTGVLECGVSPKYGPTTPKRPRFFQL